MTSSLGFKARVLCCESFRRWLLGASGQDGASGRDQVREQYFSMYTACEFKKFKQIQLPPKILVAKAKAITKVTLQKPPIIVVRKLDMTKGVQLVDRNLNRKLLQ